MLLPIFSTAAPTTGLFPAIFLDQERDMPHGFFGDRDARPHDGGHRLPAGCGLFGRLGDTPPPRADGDRPDPQDEPRGRA
ncbi:MAG: hypothetical protein ABW173_03450 [Sphingomonas sp.]